MKNLDKHRFIVNVSMIIHDGEEKPSVLVMKRSMLEDSNPGKYGIPGGKMDGTDTDLQFCAEREVYEEVGLGVKDVHYFEDHVLETENGQKLYVTFFGRVASGTLTIDKNEVEFVSWWTKEMVEDTPDEDFTKGTKQRILDFLETYSFKQIK